MSKQQGNAQVLECRKVVLSWVQTHHLLPAGHCLIYMSSQYRAAYTYPVAYTRTLLVFVFELSDYKHVNISTCLAV